MSCSRGKANPNTFVKTKLFANSAGFCQRPECNEPLFKNFKEKEIHIAEIAHIISVNNGAREKKITKEEKGSYENLILLCPNCHTIIDKNEIDFPELLINTWKVQHESRLAEVFSFKKFESRQEVRLILEPLFEENKMIFELYGPENDYKLNPESENAGIWLTKMRSEIIPNNRKILNLINHNLHLTNPQERTYFQIFKQHLKDLEAKHIFNTASISIIFPKEILKIYV